MGQANRRGDQLQRISPNRQQLRGTGHGGGGGGRGYERQMEVRTPSERGESKRAYERERKTEGGWVGGGAAALPQGGGGRERKGNKGRDRLTGVVLGWEQLVRI